MAHGEVSAAVSGVFGGYAQRFEALGGQAALFHERFVQALTSGGFAYASAEAANASPLQTVEQDLLGVINAPTDALLGRPLIGNGANGAPGTGQAGGPGGLLFGDGGACGQGGMGGAGGSGGPGGSGTTSPSTITVGVEPQGVAVSPTGPEAGDVYVLNVGTGLGDGTVSVIS